jgi:beta-lactam-binding protein with PASTA domain
MKLKEFFSLRRNRYFWFNLIAMPVVLILLGLGVMYWLNVYTRHGEAIIVPDTRGMTVDAAQRLFSGKQLSCVVSDSTYVKTKPAGSILESLPAPGQKVKEGRVIYLTVNTLNVPLMAVPRVADNSSVRQAEARMLASGFKLTDNQYISGEKDWVYGVRYMGELLAEGDKVPQGATLTLVVGAGGRYGAENDSTGVDSLIEVPQTEEETKLDDGWF